MAAAESSFSVVSAEALTYTLCLSSENLALSEAGYTFFVLWERCSCMAAKRDSGRVYVSVSVLQEAHSADIHK